MEIVITSPSLDPRENVSGISAIVAVIIGHNTENEYFHFLLGKRDTDARGLRGVIRTLLAYARWIEVLLTHRKRLIHFNLAIEARSLIRDTGLILAARVMRRRLVIHVHGGQLFARIATSRWLRWVVGFTLAGRGPKIALSVDDCAVLQLAVNGASVVVLPNCVDVADARQFSRIYATGEPLKILFMGRIVAEKGLDHIGEALKRLLGASRPVKFVIAGRGPDEERYVQGFRTLLGNSFEFRGVVGGLEKAALLRECNVFLLPSSFEGLPMALLESMAYGLVPITTDVGSIGSVLRSGWNGIVLKDQSAEEIVRAVERLDSDRALMQRLGRNARNDIVSNHAPEAYVRRLNEIYQYE